LVVKAKFSLNISLKALTSVCPVLPVGIPAAIKNPFALRSGAAAAEIKTVSINGNS
jgi:hypothetical protein